MSIEWHRVQIARVRGAEPRVPIVIRAWVWVQAVLMFAAIFGWFANTTKMVWELSAMHESGIPLSQLIDHLDVVLTLRIFGAFIVPLGCVMGWV